MKKLIAMVMTAAMVASLVPATAFAGDAFKGTASVVNKWTRKDSDKLIVANGVDGKNAPELQVRLTDVDTQGTNPQDELKFTITLDGAKFNATKAELEAATEVKTTDKGGNPGTTPGAATTTYSYVEETEAAIKAMLSQYYKDYAAGKTNLTDYKSDAASTTATGTYVGYYTSTTTPAPVPGSSEIAGKDATPFTLNGNVTNPTGTSAQSNADAAAIAYVKSKYPALSTFDLTNHTFDATGTMRDNPDKVKGWVAKNGATAPAFISYADVVAFAKDNSALSATVSNDAFITTLTETEAVWVPAQYTALTTTGALNGKHLYKETLVTVADKGTEATGDNRKFVPTVTIKGNDEIELAIKVQGSASTIPARFEKGDVISIDLLSVLDKAKSATVSVESDDVTISNGGEDLTYVSIEEEGITASIKKVATVAEEEHTTLSKNLVLKSTVGNFANGQVIELKLSNGFEFFKVKETANQNYTLKKVDDDVVNVIFKKDIAGFNNDKIEVLAGDIEIEATNAKAGSTAVITVKATNKDAKDKILDDAFNARTTVEVMKVVDYTVVLSKDADKDVPTFYNGVNTDNYGLTDDADHWSVEVTAEETFPGAWSFRKGFNFELPKGVYVTDVDVTNVEGFLQSNTTDGASGTSTPAKRFDVMKAFFDAYQDGDHVNFKFDKRVFDDVDSTLAKDEASMSFKLQLVADPGFVGDVTLKLTGELVDEQEIVIAKFVSPFEVKADQNDLKIDYRYTEIPTTITVKEAEDGLWDAKKAEFGFTVEKPDYIVFEDDPKFAVDEKSGMKLTEDKLKQFGGNNYKGIHFMVDKESAEPATVTISNMSLFMQRSIPAGAYDLLAWTSMWDKYEEQVLFAPDCQKEYDGNNATKHDPNTCKDTSIDCIIDDVTGYSDTVKEAFVNVVTAGREQDDASFTTKVVVPVGEKYIIAGENQIELDVPAYINANGYTMLPVRAVATALGINNNNVLWDQATKTVTILYGQRIITMQVGANVVSVNGSAIPASSSVEITDSRTFLGLRDLATALGVTTINWDPATKTASLN